MPSAALVARISDSAIAPLATAAPSVFTASPIHAPATIGSCARKAFAANGRMSSSTTAKITTSEATMIGTMGRARIAPPVAIAADTPQIEIPEARGGARRHHDEQGDVGGDQGAHPAQGPIDLGDGIEGFGYIGPDGRGDDPAEQVGTAQRAQREHENEQADPDRKPVFADAFGNWIHDLPLEDKKLPTRRGNGNKPKISFL